MPQAEAGAAVAVLLDARARPQGPQRVFILVVALASGAAGFWFCQAVGAAVRPGMPLALGIALGIALGVLYFAMRGTRVVVGADRRLTYSLQGRPNLRVHLDRITAVRPISGGLLGGVGLELDDPAQVEFLPQAGIVPERLRLWRERVGVDVLLEGFPADVAARLDALRKG